MANKQYLPMLVVTINSVSQVELQDVTINFDAKKIPVETKRGFSGFSRGAKVVTLEFKSAVPVAGPEFDAYDAAEGDDEYIVTIPYGRRTITSEGQFMTGSLSSSVNAATEMSCSFMGTYNKSK